MLVSPLYGKGLFSASPVFGLSPLPQSASGSGTETRDTISTEDNKLSTQ